MKKTKHANKQTTKKKQAKDTNEKCSILELSNIWLHSEQNIEHPKMIIFILAWPGFRVRS